MFSGSSAETALIIASLEVLIPGDAADGRALSIGDRIIVPFGQTVDGAGTIQGVAAIKRDIPARIVTRGVEVDRSIEAECDR